MGTLSRLPGSATERARCGREAGAASNAAKGSGEGGYPQLRRREAVNCLTSPEALPVGPAAGPAPTTLLPTSHVPEAWSTLRAMSRL